MVKKFFMVAFIILISMQNIYSVKATPEIIESYDYVMEIDSVEGKYLKFAVPDEVYEYSENMESFYITAYDEAKKEYVQVPFFLEDSYFRHYEVNDNFKTELVKKVVDEDGVPSFTFKIQMGDNEILEYNKISFETDKEVYYNVISIAGSYDNVTYDTIDNNYIFKSENESQEMISFDYIQDYEYIKITLLENDEVSRSTNITGVETFFEEIGNSYENYIKEVDVAFETEELEKTTELVLDESVLKNRYVYNIYFDVNNDYFKRTFSTDYSDHTYEVVKDENNTPSIFFNSYYNHYLSENKYKIKNGDDEPLDIKSIKAEVGYSYAFIENKYEKYFINFNNYDTDVKEYDFNRDTNDIRSDEVFETVATNFQVKEKEDDKKFLDDDTLSYILNGTIAIVVIFIVYFFFTNRKA
ncbi:MAG: hypothetical protein ACK5LY_00590 [Lachnospirales bacterium]